MLIILKIILVPVLLLLLSKAGEWWGQRRAGWLSALPWVAGPILLLLGLEQGKAFAAQAATLALATIAASEAFSLAYVLACRQAGWRLSLLSGLGAWLAMAFLLAQFDHSLWQALLLGCLAMAVNRVLLPRPQAHRHPGQAAKGSILPRMLAGALLTLACSLIAKKAGANWGGIIAVFPLLSSMLAIEVHQRQGRDAVFALTRGMLQGRPAFAVFCLVLSLLLPSQPIWLAFSLAIAACLAFSQLCRRKWPFSQTAPEPTWQPD